MDECGPLARNPCPFHLREAPSFTMLFLLALLGLLLDDFATLYPERPQLLTERKQPLSPADF